MLMSGNEMHPAGCPFLGLDRAAWDIAIDWFGLFEKGIQPMAWLELPMWFVGCFRVIREFKKLEDASV